MGLFSGNWPPAFRRRCENRSPNPGSLFQRVSLKALYSHLPTEFLSSCHHPQWLNNCRAGSPVTGPSAYYASSAEHATSDGGHVKGRRCKRVYPPSFFCWMFRGCFRQLTVSVSAKGAEQSGCVHIVCVCVHTYVHIWVWSVFDVRGSILSYISKRKEDFPHNWKTNV